MLKKIIKIIFQLFLAYLFFCFIAFLLFLPAIIDMYRGYQKIWLDNGHFKVYSRYAGPGDRLWMLINICDKEDYRICNSNHRIGGIEYFEGDFYIKLNNFRSYRDEVPESELFLFSDKKYSFSELDLTEKQKAIFEKVNDMTKEEAADRIVELYKKEQN